MASTTELLSRNRGESLAARPAAANGFSAASKGNPQQEGRRLLTNASRIRLDRIEADPAQPRKSFDADRLAQLTENMRVRGQLVPVLVRWFPETERYRVVDGERRFRAAQAAGLSELSVVVEDETDPDVILEVQLICNALRDDVQPVEQARAYKRLLDSQGLSRRDLAAKLGVDQSGITKALALLDLPEDLQRQVDAGELPASTAGEIGKLPDPEDQRELARRVVDEGLSRAATVEAVRTTAEAKAPRAAKAGQGGAARDRGKRVPAAKLVRRFPGKVVKVEATAGRPRGFELLELLEALETAAATIRAELGTTILDEDAADVA